MKHTSQLKTQFLPIFVFLISLFSVQQEVSAQTVVPAVGLTEDFETPGHGWTSNAIGGQPSSWGLGTPSSNHISFAPMPASNGSNAWMTGINPPDGYVTSNEHSFVLSSVYDFSALPTDARMYVEFDFITENEEKFEVVTLQYRISGGAWQVIGQGTDAAVNDAFTQNWYNSGRFANFSDPFPSIYNAWSGTTYDNNSAGVTFNNGFFACSSANPGCPDQNAGGQPFTLNCGQWSTARHCLPAAVNGASSVEFRFLLSADADFSSNPDGFDAGNGCNLEGFGFDNFSILPSNVTADFTAGPTVVCDGDDVLFTNNSVDAQNYTWDFGDGSPTVNTENPIHTYTNSGSTQLSRTVTLTATNTCGLSATATEIITVDPSQSTTAAFMTTPAAVGGTIDICEGDAIDFDASGSTGNPSISTYTWDFPGGTPATGSSVTESGVVFNAAGSYTIELTTETPGPCPGTDVASVTVNVTPAVLPDASFNILPVGSIIPSSEFCVGDDIDIVPDVLNGAVLTWDYGGAFPTNPAPAVDFDPAPQTLNTPGTFDIELIAQGCGSSDDLTQTIIVSETPLINFDPADFPSTYCSGNGPLDLPFTFTPASATVSATDNFGNTLALNAGGAILDPSVYVDGDMVTVTVEAISGVCTATVALPQITINLSSTLSVDDSNVPSEICLSQDGFDFPITLTPASFSANITDNFGNTLSDATFDPSSYAPGDVVEITIRAGTPPCEAIETLNPVLVVGTPDAEFDISNESLCTNDPQLLNFNFATSEGTLTLLPNGEVLPASNFPMPTTAGNYTVTHQLESGNCVSVYTSDFTVVESPLYLASDIQLLNTTVCEPVEPVLRIANAESDVDYDVLLPTGQVTVLNEVLSNDTLYLTLGDLTTNPANLTVVAERFGCIQTLEDAASITVAPEPAPITITSSSPIQEPLPRSSTPVSFLVEPSDPNYTYVWQRDGEEVGTGTETSQIFDEVGTYLIRVDATTPETCRLDAEVQVNVEDQFMFFIPNVITPNQDGLNDNFDIQSNAVEYELLIYDRWGVQVYSGDQSDTPWDGTVDGDAVPEGVYVYHIDFRTTNQPVREGNRTGTVTVLR